MSSPRIKQIQELVDNIYNCSQLQSSMVVIHYGNVVIYAGLLLDGLTKNTSRQ